MSSKPEAIPLDIDKILYQNRPMPGHVKLERRIVKDMITALEGKGFTVAAIDDGDEVTPAKTCKEAMELIFNLDDCLLFFTNPKGARRWVRLVLGNGIDIISDWGMPPAPEGFHETLEEFIKHTEDYE